MKIVKSFFDFLEGRKTYLFFLLLFGFGFMDFKDVLPPFLDENKMEIYIALATGAGISLRMGMDSANKKMVKMLSQGYQNKKES